MVLIFTPFMPNTGRLFRSLIGRYYEVVCHCAPLGLRVNGRVFTMLNCWKIRSERVKDKS